jgi:hypothetical protein
MELRLDLATATQSVLESASASAFQLDLVMARRSVLESQSDWEMVQVKALDPASKRYVCSVDRSA